MIKFLARAAGGAALAPLLPLFALEWVWRKLSPAFLFRLVGPVHHRIPPARWAHEAARRARVWWAERRGP